jgi:hypothetical protein
MVCSEEKNIYKSSKWKEAWLRGENQKASVLRGKNWKISSEGGKFFFYSTKEESWELEIGLGFGGWRRIVDEYWQLI